MKPKNVILRETITETKPLFDKNKSIKGILLYVCDITMFDVIQTIEKNVYLLSLLEEEQGKKFNATLDANLNAGDMIYLTGDVSLDGIKFFYTVEIADFCERWKVNNARINMFTECHELFEIGFN